MIKVIACESNRQDLSACCVAKPKYELVTRDQIPGNHFLLPFVDKFVFEWISWIPFHDITLCRFIGERDSWDLQKRRKARSSYTLLDNWATLRATGLLLPQGKAQGD